MPLVHQRLLAALDDDDRPGPVRAGLVDRQIAPERRLVVPDRPARFAGFPLGDLLRLWCRWGLRHGGRRQRRATSSRIERQMATPAPARTVRATRAISSAGRFLGRRGGSRCVGSIMSSTSGRSRRRTPLSPAARELSCLIVPSCSVRNNPGTTACAKSCRRDDVRIKGADPPISAVARPPRQVSHPGGHARHIRLLLGRWLG